MRAVFSGRCATLPQADLPELFLSQHATGALLGLRPGHLANHALVYRAVLEGVTFTLLAGMNRLKVGQPPSPPPAQPPTATATSSSSSYPPDSP